MNERMKAAAGSLFFIIVAAAAMMGRSSPPERSRAGHLTWLVGATSLAGLFAQLISPSLLLLLRRDAGAVEQGQVYRLLTSLWVQDGGLAGGGFNLVMLAVVGSAAERCFAPMTWLSLYIGGGVAAEVLALSWQPIGAGNSVAYMSLAGGLLGLGLATGFSRLARPLGAAGLFAASALCLQQDIHGGAVLIGAAPALLFRHRRAETPGRPL